MSIKTVNNRADKKVSLENVFALIADQYGSVWLDSSLTLTDRGRFSFIARNPVGGCFYDNNDKITIKLHNQTLELNDGEQMFDHLDKLWSNKNIFSIGYFSYESTYQLLGVNCRHKQEELGIPGITFLFYDSVLIYDHLLDEIKISHPDNDDFSDILDNYLPEPQIVDEKQPIEIYETLSQTDYLLKVNKIKNYIKEGDIYQANFTTRFEIESQTNPFNIYQRLRHLNPAPYSAYLNFGDYHILSSSPERMFKKDCHHITTGPIKGTINRGNNETEEKHNLTTLLNSKKDKAELLMIVDLERNDLGKFAKTGTVKVDNLFKPEIYSSLIHLVSDISCEISDQTKMSDIIKAMLPGGSITGAPKKRAVEIIHELEELPRNIYTGCIGYVWGDKADFNIAIRTVLHQNGTYHVNAGGGIVADSKPEAEYDEMLLKAKNLFRALGVK